MLTKRQKEVLDFVENYTTKKGYAPSFEEIRKRLKLASVSTIHFHISKLKEGGYLGKTENKARAISVTSKEPMVKIPLLGVIAAGEPIEAIQQNEFITIPKTKLPPSSEVYALRVVGNSMIDENINDGDIVLVKNQNTAENGQKVVALIDNQDVTLKKYYKEKGYIRLQPANKDMDPIIIKRNRDISIQGVVLDVIRNEGQQVLQLPEIKESKKYSTLPINQILCGDALEELQRLPDGSIDSIITDPPYGISRELN